MTSTALRAGVAILVLFAGCVAAEPSQGPTVSSSAPTATATDETGSIEGVVVDPEGRPVALVQVAIPDIEPKATSDESGRFVFNDLVPGKYTVFAQRLGYEAAAKAAEVAAGKITELRFVLTPIEVGNEGFYIMTPFDGIVQCSVSVFTPIHPCGGITGEDKDSWIFTIDRNFTFKEGIFELVWKATGPGSVGEQMELEVCDDLNREYLCTFGGTTSDYYQWADGPSPQSLRLTDMPKNKNVFLTGAGAAFEQPPLFQQRFNIYMTLCYNEECPEDYSAMPK